MDKTFQQDFLRKWKKYFGGAELPLVFFYSDDEKYAAFLRPVPGRERAAHLCLIALLNLARKGKAVAFSKETMGCQGGARTPAFRVTAGRLSARLPGNCVACRDGESNPDFRVEGPAS